MKKCQGCTEPVEAERYSWCYDCWWARDPRNTKSLTLKLADKLGWATDPNNPEVQQFEKDYAAGKIKFQGIDAQLRESEKEEALQDWVIMELRMFSKGDLHDASTGLQRYFAKDIINKIRSNK